MRAFLFNLGVTGLLGLAVAMCVATCDRPGPERFDDGTVIERYEPDEPDEVGAIKGGHERYYGPHGRGE